MRRILLSALLCAACSKPPSGPLAATTPSTLSVFEPDPKGCRWERVDPLGETRTLCVIPVPCSAPEAKWSVDGRAVAGVETVENGYPGGFDRVVCVADLATGPETVVAPVPPASLGFVGEDAALIARIPEPSSLLTRLDQRWHGDSPDDRTHVLCRSAGAWHDVQGDVFYGNPGDVGRARYRAVTPDETALLESHGRGWVRLDGIRAAAFVRGQPGADLSAAGPLALVAGGRVSILPHSDRPRIEPMIRGSLLLYSGEQPRLYDLDSGALLYESDTAVGVTFWR